MKQTLVLHPFFFSVYLILGIYSQNASQVPLSWLVRPLIISMGISVVVYYLFYWKHRDPMFAGWGTTLILIWFFSGHVYRLLLEKSSFWRTPVGGILVIASLTLPVGILASKRVWERITLQQSITTVLNVMAFILVAFSLWGAVHTLYRSAEQVAKIRETVQGFELPLPTSNQARPDIYLIIVDGYGREDFLSQHYSYDNSAFISFLKKEGFYVADQSTANYPQTELSISSSMNLQYLDEFVEGFGETSDRSPLRELLQHTIVRNAFREQGYTFVVLPSAALFAQIDDADVYYELTSLNEFEGLILSSTISGVMAESWGMDIPVQGYRLHRDYIQYSLNELNEVPALPGPKFVFAHLLSPHPPFIFDREGNFSIPDRPYTTWDASLFPGTSEEYVDGYIGQMEYINSRLMEIVTAILEKSPSPPIIIIQGDHGPGAYYNTLELDDSCLTERFSILNAYYFPDENYGSLYPTITPINSFRVIFNQYFGAELPLLEDRNYYAGWLTPYQFTDVSDKINLTCTIP